MYTWFEDEITEQTGYTFYEDPYEVLTLISLTILDYNLPFFSPFFYSVGKYVSHSRM